MMYKRMTCHHNRVCCLAVYLLFIAFFIQCQQEDPQASLVLVNGQFFTVNENRPLVQAIAIKGDRILAVGDDVEMDRFIGDSTQVIDLKGLFGCPGFNDSYVRLLNGGLYRDEIDFRGVTTLREIQTKILRLLRQTPSISWIVGYGWDQNMLPDGKWPTKRFLDVISPDIPIYLRRVCGHAALVNSKALEIARIASQTPDPPGGEIVKDPITGNPTGILKGRAMDVVSQYIPSPSAEQIESAIEFGLKEIKKFGITSIQDYDGLDLLEILRQYLDQGKLTCRVSMCAPLQMDPEMYKKLQQNNYHNMLRVSMLHGFIDGSVGSQTAALFYPYFHSTERGVLQIKQEELNRFILQADQNGLQVGIHAAGTQGNRMALDAYTLAQRINGNRDRRYRIEYAQVLTEEDIARLGQLGIVVSVQPSHLLNDIHWIDHVLGQERSRYAYAWGSLKKQEAILAFGTDWPVAPLNPMLGLYAAVTRKDTSGYPVDGWHSQERLTIREAIEAYTWGSAYAESMEKEKGSFERSKLADIVILDRNLLEVTPEEILKTHVVYTILGGAFVYKKEDFP